MQQTIEKGESDLKNAAWTMASGICVLLFQVLLTATVGVGQMTESLAALWRAGDWLGLVLVLWMPTAGALATAWGWRESRRLLRARGGAGA